MSNVESKVYSLPLHLPKHQLTNETWF